jgi:magnesium-transporting ATPase (P-type)
MGRKQPWINALVNGFIVVLVANVPEGLPATVTSCLSITAKRMAQRNVLVKRTNIIESLGSATVIASDKTGTLTQNRMTVENLWYNRAVFNAYAGGRPDVLEQMAKSSYRRATASASLNKRVVTLDEGSELTLDSNGASVLRLAAKAALTRRGSLDNEATLGGNAFTIGGFNSNTLMSPNALPGAKLAWEKFSGHARLMTLAGVCNRARYEESEAGALGVADRKVLGDASDAGLLRYCDKLCACPKMVIAAVSAC